MPDASVRDGQAFAPSHVTGIFVPRLEARDPRARGSLGAGLVLGLGVRAAARWTDGASRSIRVTAPGVARLEISTEVARRLVGGRRGTLEVRLEHALPVRQGFGSSAAGALATGLAVARALGVPRGRAVEVAHLADLFGRGGLGGVAAILGGGLELRVRAGIPPFGRVLREKVSGTVLVGTVGPPIRSAGPLGDPDRMARFRSAGGLFAALADAPSPEAFWETSEQFTEAVGLTSRRLRTVLRGLRRRGFRAAQAMFGESFFANPPDPEAIPRVRRWLKAGGVDAVEVPIASRGARVLRG